jgi:hypothetical protein
MLRKKISKKTKYSWFLTTMRMESMASSSLSKHKQTKNTEYSQSRIITSDFVYFLIPNCG